jgi:predicted SnoaL-like aldol condensation-catalyzing enzyme
MPTQELTSHKTIAIDVFQQASKGKAREAFRAHVGPEFRHHNPFFKGDGASLATAMDENAVENPEKTCQILRAVQDGDLVVVHARVRVTPSGPPASVVHIYRFEGDNIVELWDVSQPVPAEQLNDNGMF